MKPLSKGITGPFLKKTLVKSSSTYFLTNRRLIAPLIKIFFLWMHPPVEGILPPTCKGEDRGLFTTPLRQRFEKTLLLVKGNFGCFSQPVFSLFSKKLSSASSIPRQKLPLYGQKICHVKHSRRTIGHRSLNLRRRTDPL